MEQPLTAGTGPLPATRRPTMKDVAVAAGVSKALVSLVFRNEPGASEQTRLRVMEAAAAIGYRHNRTASRLARTRTRLIGVTMTLRNSFHGELVEDLQAEADEVGYEIALGTMTRTHDERRALETLLEFRCEAVILLGPELTDDELGVLAGQLPVVVIGRQQLPPGVDAVRTDDADGIGRAVDHLVGLGHRSIVHVDGGTGPVAEPRRRGYRAAMRRHGLPDRVVPGDYTEDGGTRAAHALLAAGDLPTAAVAANDRSAIGILDAVVRAGVRVPQDFSIVGYDDSALARLGHINLTSVSQVPDQQARYAVAAAVQRLDGNRTETREVVLPPQLVVRATTGPPRGISR